MSQNPTPFAQQPDLLDDTRQNRPVEYPAQPPRDAARNSPRDTSHDTPRPFSREMPDEGTGRFIDPNEPETRSGGPGCGLMGLVGLVAVVFAFAIVGLAAAAGYTSGQREANVNAAGTQNAAISAQLGRIPGDISDGNFTLLSARLQYLATLTPGVPGLAEYGATATALYLTSEPTATLTPAPNTETPTITPTLFAPALTATALYAPRTAAPAETTQDAGSGSNPGTLNTPNSPAPVQYDLAALLQEAETAVTGAQWQDAIDLLTAIDAVDPGYGGGRVRDLLATALNSYALQLYQTGQTASANAIAAQAQQLGLLESNMQYEMYMGELIMNARAGAELGSPAALNSLQRILDEGSGGRYYNDALQLLYDLYVRQGDAFVAQGQYCPAVVPYTSAVNLLSSGSANGKLQLAQQMCANATPTTDPFSPFSPGVVGTPIPGYAPIGQQ